MSRKGNAPNFLKGIFVGGAIGAVIALLSSPKNGKEIRADLKSGSRKLYDEASEKARTLRHQAKEALAKGREQENGAHAQARSEQEGFSA